MTKQNEKKKLKKKDESHPKNLAEVYSLVTGAASGLEQRQGLRVVTKVFASNLRTQDNS